MRTHLLFTAICFTLLFCFQQSTAQRTQNKWMELIMEVPKVDAAKSFKALKKKLATLSQVHIEGFCVSKKLLMLKLNPEQYFNVLVAVDEAGFNYYIKKDLHIAQVMGACEAGELYTAESFKEE